MNASSNIVIVGLGNPGKKYELTRHNLGCLVIQGLAAMHGWSFKDEKEFNAKVAKGDLFGRKVHLLLPTTYMNESGAAVKRYLNFYKLTEENVFVVSDDINLPFGELRLRKAGSSGGHNGLKSIEAHLGTSIYKRLRMGVGCELHNRTLADYVLENFSKEELELLAKFVQKGIAILENEIAHDLTHLENNNGSKE